MTSRTLLSSLALLSTTSLFAGEAAPAPAPAVEAYVPKAHSSFSIPESSRAPFWPIGWTPQKAEHVVAAAPKVTLNPEMFSVTSILTGNPSLAVINGRAYGEGEALRTPRAGKGDGAVPRGSTPPAARIFVQRILDGQVTLRADNQTVTVPLRRPELSERKPEAEEQLLSLDER